MFSWDDIKRQFRDIAFIRKSELDPGDAIRRIRDGVWFRGANVWILVFAVVLASVGLNVNSTAVIIGAMLVSPLMGPIMGVGLSLGTNDIDLLKQALRNLLVMVLVSVLASALFFLISPLRLVHPTELLARTHPTIYDVFIALFGGLAGILESSRKERGTVISGVAIATALMPPLCTAGYGLSRLNGHFFFGALYLFLINSVFIALATYATVRYLHFPRVEAADPQLTRRRRQQVSVVLLLFIIPSIWTAVLMVRDSNFERNVNAFVEAHRFIDSRYIYDYTIVSGHKRHVELRMAGDAMSEEDRRGILEAAASYRIQPEQVRIIEQPVSSRLEEKAQQYMLDVLEHTDTQLQQRDREIRSLQDGIRALQERLDSLSVAASAEEPVEEMVEEP